MSDLHQFLARVSRQERSYATLRATIRYWRDEVLARRAGDAKHVLGRPKRELLEVKPDERFRTDKLVVAAQPPEKYRVETWQEGADAASLLQVVNGPRTWECDPEGHVAIDENAKRGRHACPPDIGRHFDPELLFDILGAMNVTEVRTATTAGRACLRLRSVPGGGQLWPHWVPYGADEYELHADVERGVLLSIAGLIGGERFETHEVLEVVFDEPLDGPLESELFTYTPAWGEQVEPAGPITVRMTLAEACGRMPFTVLVPATLPAGCAVREVMYHPSSRRHDRSPTLALLYANEAYGGSLWIEQIATAPELLEFFEWETVVRGGKRLMISDVDVPGGMRIVALESAGTHVTLRSEVPRDTLLDIAASLAPAASSERRN